MLNMFGNDQNWCVQKNATVKCLTSITIVVFKKTVMLNMFGNDQNWCVQKNATVKCLTSITIIVSKKMPVLKV